MSLAFKAKVGNPLRKLVLIKLADNADDRGVCFPSYNNIAEQCEISRQSVINHVKELQSAGIIDVKKRFCEGENTSNVFTIHHQKLIELSGQIILKPMPVGVNSVVKDVDHPQSTTFTTLVNGVDHPSQPDLPPQSTTLTTLVKEIDPESPFNHQLTINESPINHFTPREQTQNPSQSPEPANELLDAIEPELRKEWLDIRKAKKQPKPTPRAMKAIQAEAAKVGLTLEQAITECCDRGWGAFRADWYNNANQTAKNPALTKSDLIAMRNKQAAAEYLAMHGQALDGTPIDQQNTINGTFEEI
jgi:hypothetical protein